MFINEFSRTVLNMSENMIRNPDIMKLISFPMAGEYFFQNYNKVKYPNSTIVIPQLKNNLGYDFLKDGVKHEVKTFCGYTPCDRQNRIKFSIKMINKNGSALSCILDIPGSETSFIAFEVPSLIWEKSVSDNKNKIISINCKQHKNEYELIHDKNEDLLKFFNPYTEKQISDILKEIC